MALQPEKVEDIIKISRQVVSLETPFGEEEDGTPLRDFIEDHDSPTLSEVAFFLMLKAQVQEVLETLTERERRVIKLRFGLEDGHSRTLEQVGEEYGITRERIRQIEAKALKRLREPQRSRKLMGWLE